MRCSAWLGALGTRNWHNMWQSAASMVPHQYITLPRVTSKPHWQVLKMPLGQLWQHAGSPEARGMGSRHCLLHTAVGTWHFIIAMTMNGPAFNLSETAAIWSAAVCTMTVCGLRVEAKGLSHGCMTLQAVRLFIAMSVTSQACIHLLLTARD